MSDDAIASRLYASTTPSTPSPTAAQPAPAQPAQPAAPAAAQPPAAQSQSDQKPTEKPGEEQPTDGPLTREQILKARAEDQERRFYSPQVTFAKVNFVPPEEPGIDAAQRESINTEAREVYGDLGCMPSDVDALNAAVADVKELPTAETRATWAGEARALLAQRYGPAAGEKLQLAQKLATRYPAVKNHLERTGFGDNPRVILKFVELAERLRGRRKI